MVEVGHKANSQREATAEALIIMRAKTLAMITDGDNPKGDVMAVARIAGIQAAKQCSTLIPLCHPLMLTSVAVELVPDSELPGLRVNARCMTCAKPLIVAWLSPTYGCSINKVVLAATGNGTSNDHSQVLFTGARGPGCATA